MYQVSAKGYPALCRSFDFMCFVFMTIINRPARLAPDKYDKNKRNNNTNRKKFMENAGRMSHSTRDMSKIVQQHQHHYHHTSNTRKCELRS